jgi:predicted negative regulator of RcsB-dependent stress response
MDTHVTEEQQLAAIKQWWKANGSSIITGVVLGFAALFATRAWFAWQDQNARNASDIYVAMTTALDKGDNTVAAERAGMLITDYSKTTYAVFAALALSRIRIEANDLSAAATQLQWALDHAGDDFVRDVVRLRLARVQLAQGDADAAERTLGAGTRSGDARVSYEDVRGDIALARGDKATAKAAWAQALADAGEDYAGRSLLQLKYDDVAAAATSPAPAQAPDTAAGAAQ